MGEKVKLTKEEFIAKYPVGTRILWRDTLHRPHTWFPGVVVKSENYYPLFVPRVWFLLDFESSDEEPRFVGYIKQFKLYPYYDIYVFI